ncbi:MAG: GntR family transcriptional regulator [Desulfobacterales bacterium]
MQITQPAENNHQRAVPLYQKVADHIRRCITRGTLGNQVNLTESSISKILNISRTPARKALTLLEQEKLIHKRSIRGYVVGSRLEGSLLKLTPEMVQLSSEDDFLHPVKEWQDVYEKIESEIIRQSILSKHRLNAQLLANCYACNRSMIQEVLHKLEVSGLVQKHFQSKWTIVPLDDKRLNAIFDVRSWLEPNLLAQAIPDIPEEVLHKVIVSHKDALSRFPETTGAELNQLELDMHDGLLQYANNSVAMVALQSAKAGLISSKHIVASKDVPLDDDDPFIEEHIDILEAVERRNKHESRLRLQAHLIKARQKVIDRLRKFREVVQENPTEFMKPWVK